MIDLTAAFEKIGKKFQLGLMNRIFRQQGIDGSPFSPDAPSTIRGRARRKAGDRYIHFFIKREGKGGTHRVGKHYNAAATSYDPRRLWHTGNFAKGAFGYTPDGDGVTVYAKDSFYYSGFAALDPSKRVTFADIVKYNSRNFEDVNGNIVSPPIIFPQTQAEVMKMTDEIGFARHELKSELIIQFAKLIPPRVEIVIG